jgi:hypothetical protein
MKQPPSIPKLADLGVTKDQSSQWQRLATVNAIVKVIENVIEMRG